MQRGELMAVREGGGLGGRRDYVVTGSTARHGKMREARLRQAGTAEDGKRRSKAHRAPESARCQRTRFVLRPS
ncbi:protein of unknown function [Paraburkholderia kururiensis]